MIKNLVKKTLRIEEVDVQIALNKIAKAAITEYLTMLVESVCQVELMRLGRIVYFTLFKFILKVTYLQSHRYPCIKTAL
ncbi:MAG: hypothetical protein ACJAW8_000684 [Oleispira sp.]|jgi:hypothetical protein